MITRNRGLGLLAMVAPLLVAGCGAGTAGIVAGSGDSGSSNSAPALADLRVPVSKTAPARIQVELSDREGESVRLELSARVPLAGGGLGAPELLTAVSGPGFPANGATVAIPGGNQPLALELEWRFPDESFLPNDGRFVEGVQLVARLASGAELVLGDDEAFSVGNDAPVVTAAAAVIDPLEGEASGIVRVVVTVADSSDDVVSVLAEFDVQGDVPDAGWQPATGFGLSDVQVSRDGTVLDFFWDTDTDLHDLEREVALRFTAVDQAPAVGPAFELSPSFRVDNNAAPIVQLDSGPLILNPDERRGIPVPFRVSDEEGDRVEMIFQWRCEGEEFPGLQHDNATLDAILADPELRREHHVCTPYPRYAQGRVIPVDGTSVRLPELAAGDSWILASGLEGKTLELLRPSSIPEPITPSWNTSPLASPVAALPRGDGRSALVLDGPNPGRLREIELATGAVVREIATLGPGLPSAMAAEHVPGGAAFQPRAVLVALDDAGVWRLARVELTSGAVSELVVSDGSQLGPVRGIASLGANVAVFTAGSALLFLDYRDVQAPRLATLLSGLAVPWGVVVDPLATNQVYLAERDAVTPTGTGRILGVKLDSHGKLPVVVMTPNHLPAVLEGPSAIALEQGGARMLVVTRAPGGGAQLAGLELGARGNASFRIGPPRALEITSIAAGPDGLRLAALPGSSELLIGGGLEQRRTIVAYEPGGSSGQRVTVDAAFDPTPRPGQGWRIPAAGLIPGERAQRTSAAGLDGAFLWSSDSDLFQGRAFLRALARDDDLGFTAEGVAPKRVRAALDVVPLSLGGSSTGIAPLSVAAADLDGDGDQDLVSANAGSNNLTVYLQESPGIFGALPLVLGGSPATIGPRSVAAADLDGDGDQDIVSANASSSNLTVFFQLSPGSFAATPLSLGGLPTVIAPVAVAAADLDGDGDQDLVSANAGSNNLTAFFQLSPGSFAAPLALGGLGTTHRPVSVAAADFDGDGDQDLVSANELGGDLTVFFQLFAGSFATTPLVLGGPAMNGSSSVAAADLDGDGDQDIASTSVKGLFVFFQLSPGRFAATPLFLGGSQATSGPRPTAAADLDGDGDMDIVSASRGGSELMVFFQLFPGSFTATPLALGGPAPTNGSRSVAAADLDGDGDLDIVSQNVEGSNVTVFFQFSPGSFAATPLLLGGPATTNGPRSVAVADLDGDGHQDLVSANVNGSNLTVFFQLFPGALAATPLALGGSGATNGPVSVAAADLDGDGDQDLVSANEGDPFNGGGNLTVFFQHSPGTFAPAPLALGGFPATDFPVSVAAADLDGDGDQDIVSANTNSNLTVFFQLSPGSFAATPLALGGPPTMIAPVSVVSADLDGDGDQDLVSANQASNNLTVFFQLLPGSFAAPPLVLGGPATTNGPSSVAAADLDGDGDQDIVSTNANGGNLTIFFQRSPGSFAATPLALGGFPATDIPVSVAAADIDVDGDQDIVSANTIGSNLTVFFQLSPGNFAATPLALGGFPTTRGPRSVAVADLDGDGDQDLVSANTGGQDLTVFWGGR